MKLLPLFATLALCAAPCAMAADTPTLILSGLKSQYQISATQLGFSIVDTTGQDANQEFQGPVRLQFSDTSLALDMDGNAGKAYRLYQAAFNRTPDLGGLGYWIDRLDANATLNQIATGFTQSAEFISIYGNNPTPEALVTRFYQNVLHRDPEPGAVAYWVGVIKAGLPRSEVLAYISESPENKAILQPAIAKGIEYLPVPVASGADGIWQGSTSNGRMLTGIVLDNGAFWMVYSQPNSNNSVAGVIGGNGQATGNTFTSAKAYDLNLDGKAIDSTSLNATFNSLQNFNGNFTTLGGDNNVAFTTQYNTEFTQAPPLSSVAGNFFGLWLQRDFGSFDTLQITADGQIHSTVVSSCKVTGTLSPKSHVSAYSFSLTFGAAPCHSPNTTVSGLAYYDPASKQLYTVSISSNRNDGYVFTGVKL